MANKSVANTTPRAIIEHFEKSGININRWFSDSDLVNQVLENPSGRTSFEDVVKLWQESYKHTGDRMIGVKVAGQLSFGMFKVIDYMMATSETPKKGLQTVLQYYPLINKGFDLSIDNDGDCGFVELQNPSDSKFLPFQYVDFVLACVITRIRFSNFTDWTPEAVYFTCPEPEEKDEIAAFFEAPVHFGQKKNRIYFSGETLTRPQPNADPYLFELLACHAEKLLSQLPAEGDLLMELGRILRERLPYGTFDLNYSARKLGMSRRSLQRQLRTQGLSYRRLLRNIRRDIAIELLSETERSVEEVGFLIGYSDSSSFHRAFKQWTGKSPGKYLNQ